MKHKAFVILVSLFLAFFSNSAFSEISFAVLPIESKGNVLAGHKEAAESSLYQNLIESGKYTIVERNRIKQIIQEQLFQTSAFTDPAKAAEIGRILGVEKLIASVIYWKSQYELAINFSVIDVATAQVELSKERTTEGYPPQVLGRFCAAEIIAEYPLLGKILGETDDIFIVSLGKNHGLKVGDRLFVARKEILLDDKGEVLFQELNRLGTMEVTKLDADRSQGKVRLLSDPSKFFKKDDLVSPEPIPKKESVISKKPLLPDVVKGNLILEDDMREKKYLSVTNSKGKTYIDGKLHLNATHLRPEYGTSHAFCYYPSPYDQLSDFILEGEMKFKRIKCEYNKFAVVFRSNGIHHTEDAYQFFINNAGQYAIDAIIKGVYFNIIPGQSTPLLNRGTSKNKFMIVAYGSRVDVYINDKFLVGFEHELFEKGMVGCKSNYGCYVTVDNIRIWEAVSVDKSKIASP